MAETINDASDRPVTVGDFARDLWVGKSTGLDVGVGLLMAFIVTKKCSAYVPLY
jgi:hypothetical protein